MVLLLVGHLSCDEIKSPNGKKTLFWIPKVKEDDVPFVEQVFESEQAGIDAYYAYAFKAGFDCINGSVKYENKRKMYKYVYCSSAGECKDSKGGVIKKRKTRSKRTNCGAQICL